MSKQLKGVIFVLIASLMYGSYGVLARYLGDSYGVLFQVGIRALIISVLLILIGVVRKSFKKINKEDIKWFICVNIFTVFSIAPITFAFSKLELNTSSFLF